MQREIDISKLTAFGIEDHPAADAPRPDAEQVEIVKTWLGEFASKSKTYRPYFSSYGGKHLVERNLQKLGKFRSITNGAFILALMELNYEVMRDAPRSPNVKVKIKLKRGYNG